MGVTIEGISTNTTKQILLNALKEIIIRNHPNGKINFFKEIMFEDFIRRKTDDFTIDIYDDEFGVIMTASSKFQFNFVHKGLSKYLPFIKFDINETSMFFKFDRCRDGKTIERIVITDSSERKISYPYEDPKQKFTIEEYEDIFFDSFPRFIFRRYTLNRIE